MGKVYATTDFHGMGKIANKILNFLQDDDQLIFCGDAIDRGPDSLNIITRLKNDSRCIYLKGNHEDMAANALKYIVQLNTYNKYSIYEEEAYDLWMYNGGESTLELFEDNNILLLEWANYFANLPLRYTYHNKNDQIVICDHAGFTPTYETKPLWDRKHFYQSWPIDTKYENTYIIHGHTPTVFFGLDFPYIDEYGNLQKDNNLRRVPVSILKYCNGHKINLDLYSIRTKKAALLNLDTFEVIYFSEEE